jgi:two-component system CheB/CheR fusion protein
VELHSLIERAETERRPVTVREIEWRSPSGEPRWLDLHVAPLLDQLGTVLTFVDATASFRLRRELEQSHQELEVACAELQSANEMLETTHQELQSTNEELQNLNHELRGRGEGA